jgi:Undecaprenyl-phosphate glucose phosphotransferase
MVNKVNLAVTKELKIKNQQDNQIFPITLALRLLALCESIMLIGSGICIYWLYVNLGLSNFLLYGSVTVAICAVVISAFFQSGFYKFDVVSKPHLHIYKMLGIIGLVFLVFVSLAFAFKVSEDFSRVWVFSWFLVSSLLIIIERNIVKSLFYKMARTGRLSRRIIIVGAGQQCERFLQQIKLNKEPWFTIIGIFDDRKERVGNSFHGHPVLGNLNDALNFSRQNTVDDIIISLPWTADQRIKEIIQKLKELPVNVRLCPDLAGYLHLNNNYSTLAEVPMLKVASKPLDGGNYILKMIVDKIFAFLVLILISPVMLIIALSIKLNSPGPVFFRQKRYGFNNNFFSVYKFRTMRHDICHNLGGEQAKKDDPRVTSVGKFLRKSSLDELPQLFNVLGGSMSLVGPRPHAVNHDDSFSQVINGFFGRYRVKPGITGWAQVNGWRGETDTTEKLRNRYEHDIYYIENWSILLDIKILIKTVSVVISSDNAY